MEGLSSIDAIDDEITQNIEAMKTHLGIECMPPPFDNHIHPAPSQEIA